MESATTFMIKRQRDLHNSAYDDIDSTIRGIKPLLLQKKEIAIRMLRAGHGTKEYDLLEDLFNLTNKNISDLLGF